MAFVITTGETAFSETQKRSIEDKDSETVGGNISCQLQVKPSKDLSSQSLSKKAVLQRIRHRKMINRMKSAFEGVLGSSQGNKAYAQEQRWLHQDDAFSSP